MVDEQAAREFLEQHVLPHILLGRKVGIDVQNVGPDEINLAGKIRFHDSSTMNPIPFMTEKIEAFGGKLSVTKYMLERR